MFKFTHNQEVRGLQILNHLLLIVGIAYSVYIGVYSYLLLSLIIYWIIGVLGINVGLHRLLSHRSFKTYKSIEKILSLIGVLTTVGSPLAWVAIHRQHHRVTEQPGDPHSPYIIGKFRAWMGLWDVVKLDLRLVRDIRSDSFQRNLHKNYITIIFIYCVILALINPWLIIFAYSIPACLCLHSTSSIIVIAHIHGYRSHDTTDQSRNSWIANIITLGEGWHNNHHAKPYKWSNWERWWEWDLPSLIIRLIKQ
jgi:fatty-acid desaturase